MTVGSIEVHSGDQNDLIMLEGWLRHEQQLRGAVRLNQRRLRPGEMGGAFEIIEVAVGSGGVASVFVVSLFTWLSQRTKAATLRLKVRRPDGAEVELDLDRVKDADVVADTVLSFLKPRP